MAFMSRPTSQLGALNLKHIRRVAMLQIQSKCFEDEARGSLLCMPDVPPRLDTAQLGAYFALMEVAGLLKHAVEQQLREVGDLSYVQFQLLARLGLDSPTGSERMTDLADGVVYSRSGLTYQAGLLEKAGLVTRTPSANDERGSTSPTAMTLALLLGWKHELDAVLGREC